MNIYYLIIEITRKCNFTCDHCLRGEAEKKDINFKTIDALLNNDIEYISSITFTGGEPSLNVPAIDYFLSKCKDKNIEIGNFYIATNGGESSGNINFLQTLIKLYCYCSSNEISQVEISKSDYHEYQQNENAIKKLKCLNFVNERSHLKYSNLIHEGKAKKLIENARRITSEKELKIDENNNIINDELYINCNGDICLSCNLSYRRQSKNKIGNILNNKLKDLAILSIE